MEPSKNSNAASDEAQTTNPSTLSTPDAMPPVADTTSGQDVGSNPVEGPETPSLTSDVPVANPTVSSSDVAPEGGVPNAPFEAGAPAASGDTAPDTATPAVTAASDTEPLGMATPPADASEVAPKPQMTDVSTQPSPDSAVPPTVPVAAPASDKKTVLILGGVAIVLIVAVIVLFFM